MLERFDVVMRTMGQGGFSFMSEEKSPSGKYVLYADAQATIADLQGQVAKLKARLEIDVAFNIDGEAVPAPPNMPDGIECRDATIQLQDKEIAALQQRVAQLEGEIGGRDSRIEALCRELARVLVDRQALQADHARVLGLVQALPKLEGEIRVGLHLNTYYISLDGAHLSWPTAPSKTWMEVYRDLLIYRASLPAQRAKLAQGGA